MQLLQLPIVALLAFVASPCSTAAPQTPEAPVMPDDTEIKTTASGLKYSVLEASASADSPRYGDRVRVHYSGWLLDGTMFDSSVKRGEPSEFGLGQVIEGWNEGLALMKVGDRYKFTIPYALAYGEQGRPPVIPAKADLVFEVELIAITARAMRYVAWEDSDAVQRTESGLAYRKLVEGKGEPASEASLVKIAYAMYDDKGKPVMASSMDGAPLLQAPDKLPLVFMKEAMAFMRVGDRVLLHVPKGLGLTGQVPPGVDAEAPALWQLELVSSMKFTTPEFSMPTDEELTTTASGLKYRILREGTGNKPKPTSRVTVHYQGWLTSGEPFDGSYGRGEPATFGLNGVIAGWTEGLQLVGEGGMIQLVIPGDLAYGKRGSPPKIGADATLVFVVELIHGS